MTGIGSFAGDFCSHIEMGSPKVYVICRVVKMHWQPALSPPTLRLLPPVSWETQIPSDMCSPTWKTHIPSDMCSPTLEKHIPSAMSSPTRETHIPSDMCSPTKETHITSDICSPTWETSIPSD